MNVTEQLNSQISRSLYERQGEIERQEWELKVLASSLHKWQARLQEDQIRYEARKAKLVEYEARSLARNVKEVIIIKNG